MIDRKHLVFPFAALLVAGCAASSDRYPSLAVRDVERAEGTFDPVPGPQLDVPEVEVDVGPDLGAGLTSLVADAQAAHTAFTDFLYNLIVADACPGQDSPNCNTGGVTCPK